MELFLEILDLVLQEKIWTEFFLFLTNRYIQKHPN